MPVFVPERRAVLVTGGALLAAGLPGLGALARADGLAPTPTMRGGANNYRPGAPIVERIGGGGFLMTGSVRRAGSGAPLPGRRIQMWAHTTEGHERDERSHGATLSREDGTFELDMPQIVPAFGQSARPPRLRCRPRRRRVRDGVPAPRDGERERDDAARRLRAAARLSERRTARTALVWALLAAALIAPLGVAATSPLLAWRQPIYIAAGLAGVTGLCLLLVQPLLAAGALPGLAADRARRLHRATGIVLLAAVAVHVGGLWITSPPDVVDALLLRSATPFSIWGVIAMWAVVAAALLVPFRRRLRARTWRSGHTALVGVSVAGTVVHALLIDGTMGTVSKVALCALASIATAKAVADRKAWRAWRATSRRRT